MKNMIMVFGKNKCTMYSTQQKNHPSRAPSDIKSLKNRNKDEIRLEMFLK